MHLNHYNKTLWLASIFASFFVPRPSFNVFFYIQADRLSKEALHISGGLLEYMEYIEGACIVHGSAQLLWAFFLT